MIVMHQLQLFVYVPKSNEYLIKYYVDPDFFFVEWYYFGCC